MSGQATLERPAAATSTGVFAIVRHNVIISDPLHEDRNPLGRAGVTMGDVAKLSDGRLVARYGVTQSDGSIGLKTQPWSPTADPKHVKVSRPADWPGNFQAILEQPPGFHVLGPPRDDAEIEKFIRLWPVVAARMGLDQPAAAVGLFDPGTIAYSKTFGFGEAMLRAVLARHCNGDNGRYGSVESTPDLDADQRWCLDAMPIPIVNKAAVTDGVGVVRSSYKFSEAEERTMPKPQGWYSTPGLHCYDVTTILTFSRQNRTIIQVGGYTD